MVMNAIINAIRAKMGFSYNLHHKKDLNLPKVQCAT